MIRELHTLLRSTSICPQGQSPDVEAPCFLTSRLLFRYMESSGVQCTQVFISHTRARVQQIWTIETRNMDNK